MAASVSLPVLSDLPPVRQDPVPGAYRPAVLGHRLRSAGPNCGSRRAAVRSRNPVHRGALRRLAHVPHHTTTSYRHATDRTAVTKCRVGSHRRGIQGGRQCAQVWNISHRYWPGHHFPNSPQCNYSCVCVCVCVCVRAHVWLAGWLARSFVVYLIIHSSPVRVWDMTQRHITDTQASRNLSSPQLLVFTVTHNFTACDCSCNFALHLPYVKIAPGQL